jgi:hypothetical protein
MNLELGNDHAGICCRNSIGLWSADHVHISASANFVLLDFDSTLLVPCCMCSVAARQQVQGCCTAAPFFHAPCLVTPVGDNVTGEVLLQASWFSNLLPHETPTPPTSHCSLLAIEFRILSRIYSGVFRFCLGAGFVCEMGPTVEPMCQRIVKGFVRMRCSRLGSTWQFQSVIVRVVSGIIITKSARHG